MVGLRLLSCLCVWRSHSCCAVVAARCSWDLRVEMILLLREDGSLVDIHGRLIDELLSPIPLLIREG